MPNNYDNYLCKVLKLFSKESITADDIEEINPSTCAPLCKLRKLKPNTEFLTMGNDANTVYIALSGTYHCLINSVFGDSIVADTMLSPYIFGLLEYILNVPKYTASIRTIKASIIIEVPANLFFHAMHNNLTVANVCISYFANVSQYYMDMAEIRALYNLDDTILLYLFNSCNSSSFPFTLTVSRKTMSHLLHINLRSLYRHLSKLQEQDYFSIINGKITINSAQYKKLDTYCTSFLGTNRRPFQIYSAFPEY
ncbi:hypothetical protein CS063_15230 [Sporanaerobium hydrogeniformans]|uniref:Uncharacterized protein n=1 Tax=Sporanaerobium hydrogeniformans TaxID=3072179 RepID=A0AC61DAJ2_9FIRM|nr:Crp/Fnr family transcriptional regulator [Sporanaerobium hydrogeniformans]PHV69527.1 hypothetical protein CS063_15230 [Sporanaerobium hydrogeniformans]